MSSLRNAVRKSNYDIVVKTVSHEYYDEDKKFYEGLYSVEINNSFEINFLPSFRESVETWPPKCSEGDRIVSRLDALISLFYCQDYIITPFHKDSKRDIELMQYNHQTQKYYISIDDASKNLVTVVFYVTQEAFDVFMKEIQHIMNNWYELESFEYSYLKDYKMVQFIEEKFFKSGYVNRNHLKQVCK